MRLNDNRSHMKHPSRTLLIITLFLFLLMCIQPLFAIASSKGSFPKPQGYITDLAGLLSPESTQRLDNIITYMKQKTGAEVAVATLKTISPYTIEDYAVRLFEEWGIGEKGKDNGVLILVAMHERKIRIEVGYGLEGVITDGTAGEIIRDIIAPAFKQGRFDQGLVEGTETVIGLIAREYSVAPPEGTTFKTYKPGGNRKKSRGGGLISFLIAIFVLIFLFRSGLWPLLFLGFPSGRGGGWSGGGGGFGGGFGGFGGGMSGGGGASGGW